MEFDFSKLRGRIIERFGTIDNFCVQTKRARTSMSAKLNNKSSFSPKDIYSLVTELDIEPEQIGSYFFTLKVQ